MSLEIDRRFYSDDKLRIRESTYIFSFAAPLKDMFKVIKPDIGRNYATILPTDDHVQLCSLDRETIKALFADSGALLFRGFQFELDTFKKFTSHFCSQFVHNESGNRLNISSDGTTQTVNLGQDAFPLHPELSRVPWRPDIAWFACTSPPRSGGETLLCDGVPVVKNLSRKTRDYLMGRSILYREETPLEAFTEWLGIPPPDEQALMRLSGTSPFQFSLSGGKIYRSFLKPFFHIPLFSEDRVFGNFLLFARYQLKVMIFPTFEDGSIIPDSICEEIKAVTDDLTTAHRWRHGDILMIDNSRVMHGRHEVNDMSERVIWTQFGYASFLPDDRQAAETWRKSSDPRRIFFGPGAKSAAIAT